MPRKLKEKLSDIMNIPDELICGTPRIEFDSNKSVWIENYKGIIEYSDTVVRINTSDFIIALSGINLTISSISPEDVCIAGNISSVEFKS